MLVWLGNKSDLVNPKAFISLGGGQFYVASVSHSTYEFDLREFFSVYAFRKSDSHALPASGPQGLIWRSCGSVYGTSKLHFYSSKETICILFLHLKHVTAVKY